MVRRQQLANGPCNKDFIKMNRTCSGITGIIKSLKSSLNELDKEIRADANGRFEFDKELHKMRKKKEDIERRMATNQAWANKYDKEMGPCLDSYKSMTGDIGSIYEKAKEGHTNGLQILMNEFGYHPEFKRPGDSFSAVPFRPL